MSSQEEFFMEQAYAEALKAAERGDYAVGAVVVLDGEIISMAGNEVIVRGIVPYAHAEFLALDKLRGTKYDKSSAYKQMTVYTTLAPCPQCWGRILVAGIKEVVYGAPDPISTQDYSKSVPEIFKLTAPKIRELKGNLGVECKKLFEATRTKLDEMFFREQKVLPEKDIQNP